MGLHCLSKRLLKTLSRRGDNIFSNASLQVGFLSAMLVDDGESVFVKGLRICEEYEERKLMPIFAIPVSEWAKTLGANKFVSTYSDTFRPSCRPISKMVRCLCYVIKCI